MVRRWQLEGAAEGARLAVMASPRRRPPPAQVFFFTTSSRVPLRWRQAVTTANCSATCANPSPTQIWGSTERTCRATRRARERIARACSLRSRSASSLSASAWRGVEPACRAHGWRIGAVTKMRAKRAATAARCAPVPGLPATAPGARPGPRTSGRAGCAPAASACALRVRWLSKTAGQYESAETRASLQQPAADGVLGGLATEWTAYPLP